MKFNELFEQYGKSVPFTIPSTIAAIKPKPDYSLTRNPLRYQISLPKYAAPSAAAVPQDTTEKSSTSDKKLPIKIGKEIIKPSDPRHAAIWSLLYKRNSR